LVFYKLPLRLTTTLASAKKSKAMRHSRQSATACSPLRECA